MSTPNLYRLTGAMVMAGSVLFVIGVTQGGPPPKVAPIPHLLVLIFAILVCAGLPGLYLRQRDGAGMLGLLGAALVFVSIFLLAGFNYLAAFLVPGLADTAPELLQRFPNGEWTQLVTIQVIARGGLGVGLLIFVIATYRAAVLPRWAAVIAVLGGLGAIVQLVVVLFGLPEPIGMVVLFLPLGLLSLGYGVWARAEDPAPASTHTRAPLAHGGEPRR
jgi:hypothetical protein